MLAADLGSDCATDQTADEHAEPVCAHEASGNCRTEDFGEVDIGRVRNTDLDTYIEEDGNCAKHEVTEGQRSVRILCNSSGLASSLLLGSLKMRLRNAGEENDNECDCENRHCDNHHRSSRCHRCVGYASAHEPAHENRGNGSSDGVA